MVLFILQLTQKNIPSGVPLSKHPHTPIPNLLASNLMTCFKRTSFPFSFKSQAKLKQK